jgi:hypothetical protein
VSNNGWILAAGARSPAILTVWRRHGDRDQSRSLRERAGREPGRRTTRPASANVLWYQRIGRGSVNVMDTA